MKRKLLNGVMLLTALAAVGTLSSCKDYDSEQLQQQQYNGSFTQKLDDLQSQLDALRNAHNDYETATNARLDLLQQELDQKLSQADLDDLGIADQGDLDDLKQELEGDIKEAIDNLRAELTKPGAGCTCPDVEKAISDALKEFETEYNSTVAAMIADALGTAIEDIANLKSQMADLDNAVKGLQGDITKIKERLANCATKDEVDALIANVQTVFDAKLVALQLDINALKGNINSLKVQLADTNTRLDNLSASLNGLSAQIGELQSSLNETDKKAVEALAQAEANKRAITQVSNVIDMMRLILDNLGNNVGDLGKEMDDLKAKYQALDKQYKELNDKLDGLMDDIYSKSEITDLLDALSNEITNALEGKADNEEFQKLVGYVNYLSSELAALQGEVNRLLGIEDRLNSLITSIIVQGVYNPLFGTFSMPIGVQSNMLLGYYGRFDGSYTEFPTRDCTRAYNNEDPFTQEEYDAISTVYDFSNAEKFTNGQLIATGNMGKVFMTLNPNNVDVSGANITLERSNGVASEARLTSPKPSDAELHFGASRAAKNGFYESDVVFDATDKAISSMKYEITPGLKTALKDAVKDHTKGDIFTLLRKLYDQLNLNLPAYGLKAGWTVNGEGYATFSKYEIATVLFSPLSYSTYYGQSIGKHLPTRSPIDDALLEINKEKFKFHLNLKIDIKPVDANFEFDKVRFNYESKDFEIDLSGLTFTLEDGSTITFGKNETVKLNPKGIDDFLHNLEAEIDRATHKFTDDMDAEFRRVMNNLVDQVNNNVNKAMKDLDKQVNDKIESLLDDIQGKINDKAGKLIDFFNKLLKRYNDAADRINGWLDDPNHLLQPTLIYIADDGQFNRMSTHFDYPSTFVQAGGDGVELFASSNTLEVFAPAYKKFVAVAGEWNPDGVRTSDPNVYKELNSSAFMAKVFPGEQIRIALPTGKMKKGYKYEVIYSAIDYRGWISTQRFYVRIK